MRLVERDFGLAIRQGEWGHWGRSWGSQGGGIFACV